MGVFKLYYLIGVQVCRKFNNQLIQYSKIQEDYYDKIYQSYMLFR